MNTNQNTRTLASKILPISFVVLFCAAWFTHFQWKMLTHELVLNDDSCQHIAWMWKWHNGHHFNESDYLNHAAEQFQQWGYWAVGRLAMLVVDPITFSKYLSFFTLLMACLFAFFMVKKRFGNTPAMAAAVLVGLLTFERMVGSNGRAFGFPMLLMFLYFFTDGKWRGVAISLIVTSLFYPTVSLIELAVLGFHGMRWAFLQRNNLINAIAAQRGNLTLLAIAMLLSVGIPAAKSRQLSADPVIGPMFSAEELLSLPMFSSENGRVDFPGEMRLLERVISNGLPEVEYMWPLVAVVSLLALGVAMQEGRQHRRFDLMLLYLPMAGIGLLLVARWQLPRLFLPTRFLTYMYPVFYSMLLARLVGAQPVFFAKKWAGSLLLAALLVVPFWLQSGQGREQMDYVGNAALYEKVNQLPPDHGLVAGPAMACDMLPMFCQRSVLFSYEGFHALYFKNYWEKMAGNYRDYMDAITSPDHGAVISFVKKHKISYLILDIPLLERGKKYWDFNPFREYMDNRLAANPERQFAVMKMPTGQYMDVDAHYRILDCRRWLDE